MENRSVCTRRILLVDDVVPEEALGAGYPRLLETIAQIQSVPSVEVSFFPTLDHRHATNDLGAIRPWTGSVPLEIIADDLEKHLGQMASQHTRYDAVVISRPHNYEYVIETLRTFLPEVPIVYDAEALFYRRLERQLAFCSDLERPRLAIETTKMKKLEAEIASEVDELVFVSDEEADLLRPFASGNCSVNSPLLKSVHWTEAGFTEREGVVFVASWSSGPKSPNVDGMQWFAREVWPRVLARLGSAKLRVTGGSAPAEVLRFSCESIVFLGRVEDLDSVYACARVIVVPNRYGAGVKNKTIEALQCGVPTVSTPVGAEGVPVSGSLSDEAKDNFGYPSFLYVTEDATRFAERIVSLLSDESLWQRERDLLKIQCEEFDRVREHQIWPEIIDRLLNRSPVDVAQGDAQHG
ncbi:MAG TPA: glycosyltransferase family 4 protein [Acidimicrobiales bacterium]|nr:glycosyltransferase family 4 protein [Acidimicrobiales bacterium]